MKDYVSMECFSFMTINDNHWTWHEKWCAGYAKCSCL